MSETQQYQTTWAAADRALLDVALAALPTSVAVGPVVTVEWGGTTSYAARLSTTVAPIGAPPTGVREEVAPVAGVFMQGPTLPTPFEWLTRAGITGQRRLQLFVAMRSDPMMAAILDSILVLQAVDSSDPEIQATVPMVLAAGLLTEAEAAALLA